MSRRSLRRIGAAGILVSGLFLLAVAALMVDAEVLDSRFGGPLVEALVRGIAGRPDDPDVQRAAGLVFAFAAALGVIALVAFAVLFASTRGKTP